jgi:beta-glucosidase
MASYSSWNGVKDHGNAYLLNTVLKGQLAFGGFVVSDWAGVKQLPDSTYNDQLAHAINAGVDMIMVPDTYVATINGIITDVNAGKISQARIDDAVDTHPHRQVRPRPVQPPIHRSHLHHTGGLGRAPCGRTPGGARSLVLLKNNGALPLSKTGAYKIVVGGKSVDNLGYQMGGWSISWQGGGWRDDDRNDVLASTSASDGRHEHHFAECGYPDQRSLFGRRRHLGGRRDAVRRRPGRLVHPAFGNDNSSQLSDICSRVTVCIAILYSGRPLIISNQLPKANAFVAAWLPGTEATGVTDALFGGGFTAKLPVTWPNAVADEPINSGDGKPSLFPLGYGLSPY